MYILRIWGIGRVECASSDALAVVRRRARKSALYLCHRALARTHAAGAAVPAITGRKYKHVISAELLMRTEPEQE